MFNSNFALERECYNWENVCFWGICAEHGLKAYHEHSAYKRVIHLTLAFIEVWPILGQIISLFEKFLVEWVNISNLCLEQLNTWNRKQVKEYYKVIIPCTKNNPLFMTSFFAEANWRPSVEGLNKLGKYLVAHHSLQKDSIQVCATLVDFKQQLNRLQSVQGDFKWAYVVPTHCWRSAKRNQHYTQHVVTVGVERKGTTLHIALLDSVYHGYIASQCIGLDLDDDVDFSEQELVLSYIFSANLPFQDTKFYHSEICREVSKGCWAFALKDAVAFLKTDNFFQQIKIKASSVQQRVKGYVLEGIEKLPVSFMKTAQYKTDEFEEYFTKNPEQDNPEIRKKIAKHQTENLNLRISHAAVKWLEKLRISSKD